MTYPQVADVTSGLSYRQFSSPWRQGCPSGLNTPMLDWTAGENTVAGHVSIGGSVIDWHGLACSGPLAQQFGYTGPAELQAVTTSLLAAIDPAYYAGVQHSRTTEIDKATRVSGHQAWEIEFTMTYPDGASQGMTWNTELGAVVVADRGQDLAPAVFYVSVPATLGVPNVDVLIDSLGLSQQSAGPGVRERAGSGRLGDVDVAAAAVHGDLVGGGQVVLRTEGALVVTAVRCSTVIAYWVAPRGSTMVMSPPLLTT